MRQRGAWKILRPETGGELHYITKEDNMDITKGSSILVQATKGQRYELK